MKIVSQPSYTPDQKDVDAICALVSKLEHAQQNELVDEFASLFLPEAVWTTAHGLRLEGAEKIREFTSKVLPGAMAHGTATYTPGDVLELPADCECVIATGLSNFAWYQSEGPAQS